MLDDSNYILVGGVESVDILHLTENADLVVVGQVASVADLGSTSVVLEGEKFRAAEKAATVRVLRLLKAASKTATVVVNYVYSRIAGYEYIPANVTGIFFLRQNEHGSYTPVSAVHPFIVAVSQAQAEAQGTAALDHVHTELAQVLLAPETSMAALGLTIDVPWRTPRYLAVEALRPINAGFGKTHSRTYREQVETLKSILQHVVEVGDYEAKLWAAALLLKYKDTSQIGLVKQALLSKKESIPTLVRVELLSAVRYGAGQKQCIPALAELLSTQDVEVRRTTAYALREAADATAIPLYKQALYDADSEVRYHAVTSLADVTKSFDYYPSTDVFRTNEQRYLDYWRNWQYQK